MLNILLQILDDGRVTDAQGRTVNFENTVIVMTTNAGSSRGVHAIGFTAEPEQAEKDRVEKALLGFLRPEFLNRVDEVIVFNQLTAENFVAIARIMLGDLAGVLAEKGISLTFTDSVAEYIARKSYSDKYGARNMRRFIQREVEDQIANSIVSDYSRSIREVLLSEKDDALYISCV